MRASLLLVVLAACTHHRPISEAHEVGGTVRVQVSGTYEVEAVTVSGGFVATDGEVVPLEHVTKVTDRRHLRGALKGFGFGVLIGGATGAVIGYASGDDDCDDDSHGDCFLALDAEGKALLGGIVLGVLGGGVGLIFGAVQGSTIIYESKATQTVVRAIGPPGSVAGVSVTF